MPGMDDSIINQLNNINKDIITRMEDDLVMNRLPLPKYYDGTQWNTVLKPTRKCIPKYLHDDLPALKHIYIKEKFKQIGKFNCPKLQYFDHMIKQKRSLSKPIEKKPSSKKHKKQVTYNELKEQLQYALIIADTSSNVVDGLLEKAKSCHRQLEKSEGKRSKNKSKSRNMSLDRDTGRFFGNTVDLVFRQRKKQFDDQMKIKPDPDITSASERIDQIKLISFEGN